MQVSPTCEDGQQHGQQVDQQTTRSKIHQIWTHSWFQILLISFICFCCPGVSVLSFLHIVVRVLTFSLRRCIMPLAGWEVLARSTKQSLQMPPSHCSLQRPRQHCSSLGRFLTALVRECAFYWAVGPIPCIQEVSCASTVRTFDSKSLDQKLNCLSSQPLPMAHSLLPLVPSWVSAHPSFGLPKVLS